LPLSDVDKTSLNLYVAPQFMKKFYYFSEKSLNFLEIKHFRGKVIAVFTISVIVVSSFIFSAIYFISNLSHGVNDLESLKKENEQLKNSIISLSGQYVKLESELNSLSELSSNLRLAANLNPISPEELKLGVGGTDFINALYSELGSNVSDAMIVAEKVIRRFRFEKAEFEEITSKMRSNKELFESIPAIIPTEGQYSTESFGMRFHPILHVNKMHSGVDIINDIGTNVKASGKGKVIFVGIKGGYGLTMEVDHGFGYHTIYAHLSSSLVKEGANVKRGEVIAKSGTSGLSSGPHLHYEVLHNGQNLNPSDFFFDEYDYFEYKNSN
jgi:murein DD-endopeptidase MepM/ murein hydrolase activator NlpD